jgi:hypothetical protein
MQNNQVGEGSSHVYVQSFEYTVTKQNSYGREENNSDTPHAEFKKSGPQTLKLSLIFDTYEKVEDVSRTTVKLRQLMESKTRQGATGT